MGKNYHSKILIFRRAQVVQVPRDLQAPSAITLNPLSHQQTRTIPHHNVHIRFLILRGIFFCGSTRAIFAPGDSIVGYYLTDQRNVSRILTPCWPVFVKYGSKIRVAPLFRVTMRFLRFFFSQRFGATAQRQYSVPLHAIYRLYTLMQSLLLYIIKCR